jgi:hypothetical protein
MTERMVTTYSMWSLFRNCRKACYWRYLRELAPIKRDPHLGFGALIHECLETWHRDRDLSAVLRHLDQRFPNRTQDDEQRRDCRLATAMMTGYASRYPIEDFDIVALERTFEGEIINPATGARSRSFVLAGKVDGLVRIGDEHCVLEHKTASSLDGDYLERLWTDFQITLYAYYVEQTLGLRISGVLYNVLVKARLKQKRTESEADFQARLLAKYEQPAMFHREMLYLSRDQFTVLRAELWELTQAFLDARRRNTWYQNTGHCFSHFRPCPYFALCRSNDSPNVIENFYQQVPPHEELRETSAIEHTTGGLPCS